MRRIGQKCAQRWRGPIEILRRYRNSQTRVTALVLLVGGGQAHEDVAQVGEQPIAVVASVERVCGAVVFHGGGIKQGAEVGDSLVECGGWVSPLGHDGVEGGGIGIMVGGAANEDVV